MESNEIIKSAHIERCINFIENENGDYEINNDNEVQILLNYLKINNSKKINNNKEYWLKILDNNLENEFIINNNDFKKFLIKKKEIENNNNKDKNNDNNNEFIIDSYNKSIIFNINIKYNEIENKNIFQSGDLYEFLTSLYFKTYISVFLRKKFKSIKGNSIFNIKQINSNDKLYKQFINNNIDKFEFDLIIEDIETQALKELLKYFRFNLAIKDINDVYKFESNLQNLDKPKYNIIFEIALDLINQSKKKIFQIKNHIDIIKYLNENISNNNFLNNNSEIIYFFVTNCSYINFFKSFIQNEIDNKNIKDIIKMLEESKIKYFIIYVTNIYDINEEDKIIENIKFKEKKNIKENYIFNQLKLYENENKFNYYLCNELKIFINKIHGLFSKQENNFTRYMINNMYIFYENNKDLFYLTMKDIIQNNKDCIKKILNEFEEEKITVLKEKKNLSFDKTKKNIKDKNRNNNHSTNENESKEEIYLTIINCQPKTEYYNKIIENFKEFSKMEIEINLLTDNIKIIEEKISELIKNKLIVGIIIYINDVKLKSIGILLNLTIFKTFKFPYYILYNTDNKNLISVFIEENNLHICPVKDFTKIKYLLKKNIILQNYKKYISKKYENKKDDIMKTRDIKILLNNKLCIVFNNYYFQNKEYFNKIIDNYSTFFNKRINDYCNLMFVQINDVKNKFNNKMLNKKKLLEIFDKIEFKGKLSEYLNKDKLNDYIFYDFYNYFDKLFFSELINHFLEVFLD